MLWPFSILSRKRAAAALKAECERANRLDLPWRLGFPTERGYHNFRGVHSLVGYTVDVLNAEKGTWEWAEHARQCARRAMVHRSGIVEWQGPFKPQQAVDRILLLTIPRLFRQPTPTRKWLASCGIDGGDVGASGGSEGSRVASGRPPR